MFAAVVIPCVTFMLAYTSTSGGFRYHNRMLALVAVVLISLGVLIATRITYIRWLDGKRARAHIVVTALLYAACFAGVLGGDAAYWNFDYAYHSYKTRASYFNIDPSLDKGQAYMDAGQVYFKEGSTVSVNKGKAFQNQGTYCVAPIVRQPLENQEGSEQVETEGPLQSPASGTFDWWAVGKDCCDKSSGSNFVCGESANPLARSGLRAMDDESREYYLMAVQAWSSQYKMPTVHPLLFWWVQDPLQASDELILQARRRYVGGILLFFIVCLVFAILAHYVLAHYLGFG